MNGELFLLVFANIKAKKPMLRIRLSESDNVEQCMNVVWNLIPDAAIADMFYPKY